MRSQVNQGSPHTVRLSIISMIAYRNLTGKKLRSLLTLLGIAIGIGSVYLLLSFSFGLRSLVTNQVVGSQSIRTIDVNSPNASSATLNDITVERVRGIPDVKRLSPIYYFPGSYKVNNSESDTIVYGVDSNYADLTNQKVVHGDFITKNTTDRQIVVNTALLSAIGLGKNPGAIVGKTLDISIPFSNIDERKGSFEHNFTIVGVVDSGSGAEVYMNAAIFRGIGVNKLTQLKVGVDDVSNVARIRAQIESLGLKTASPVDTLNEINKVFTYFTYVLIGFGSIGMIIAVLGMFNTLTISLLERTKEIGLMLALGARSVDMKRLFVVEALLLSLIGSILGIGGAIILGQVINIVMGVLAHGRGVVGHISMFANPIELIVGVLAFMIIVGLLVVIIPARQAERISPIEALRRE